MTAEADKAGPAPRSSLSVGGAIALHHLFDDLAWLWLFGVFLLVMLTFRDYGIVWDAEVQDEYGKKLLAFYLSGFADRSAFSFQNLYLYGGAFDLTAAVLNLVSPLGEYETRSLLGGLIGVLGLAGCWRLARLLGGERAGFFALVLLTLTPDYYGHMPINPKDAPFAAGMIWCLHLACRSLAELPQPRLSTVLTLGFALGLTLGTRVGGVLALFYLGAGVVGYLGLLAAAGTPVRELAATTVRLGRAWLPALLVAWPVMGFFWPWGVMAPLNPLRAMEIFSHFTWPNSVLAAGVVFKAAHPPAWYLPWMLLVKLPELVLIGLALALWFALRLLAAWQRAGWPGPADGHEGLWRLQQALVALAALFPVAYFIVARPEVYNGIRHFLFVLPPLAVLAGLGFDRLWRALADKPPDLRRAVAAVFAGAALTQAWIMMALHPNQYIYYNALVGGVHGASGRYELDYWGTSLAEAAERLAAYVHDQDRGRPPPHPYKVLVCAEPESAMYFLPAEFRLTRSIREGDFFLGLTLSGCAASVDGTPIGSVERFGVVLSVIKDRRRLRH